MPGDSNGTVDETLSNFTRLKKMMITEAFFFLPNAKKKRENNNKYVEEVRRGLWHSVLAAGKNDLGTVFFFLLSPAL